MDWEESVQPGNYSWQRPAWQQRTDADRRRDARQRRRANGVGTRQRTPSPGEGRRPNGGGEPLLEEDTRAMLEELVAARQPVEEWDGEAFEEWFRGSPEEERLLCWRRGEATATLRRSGERTEGSARVPTPPLAPVIEPSALPLPPPVQQVSNVAGPHGLVFQPFAMQQQRLPQTEYPLDRQQQRQLRRPGPYQEQQQHRQLPRLQPQQHQREEVRVETLSFQLSSLQPNACYTGTLEDSLGDARAADRDTRADEAPSGSCITDKRLRRSKTIRRPSRNFCKTLRFSHELCTSSLSLDNKH
ncbi:unnamed protein product [Trichogramma brassicae]|uniref:Uncharacterized protein n=1 Tax=Trichogramma brassicae TaxID=86971 RepID=A0A6H5IXV1_9HYME|nr:unnamed protein product [Trichogramma brassicae]